MYVDILMFYIENIREDILIFYVRSQWKKQPTLLFSQGMDPGLHRSVAGLNYCADRGAQEAQLPLVVVLSLIIYSSKKRIRNASLWRGLCHGRRYHFHLIVQESVSLTSLVDKLNDVGLGFNPND